MTERRTVILDAAIETVGTKGVRGLTHRAVDEAAGLPKGSTSNVFRSRDALLAGIVEQFANRERTSFENVAATDLPLTPEDLGRTLAQFAMEATRANRSVTLARYALLVEGALRPSLRTALGEAGSRVDAWARQWLRAVKSPDPVRDWDILANFITGMVLHELAHPSKDFNPTNRITNLIHVLVEASCPS